MANASVAEDLFFNQLGLHKDQVLDYVRSTLHGADDGELYLEYTLSESIALDDGRIRSASFDVAHGFGLRAIQDDRVGYGHCSQISMEALKRCGQTVRSVLRGHHGQFSLPPIGTNRQLYAPENPLDGMLLPEKISLLQAMDVYARAKDPRVHQVSCQLSGEWQIIFMMRPDGYWASDIRPLVRLNVVVVVKDGNLMESGSSGSGGRTGYGQRVEEKSWQGQIDEALRQALVNLHAKPAPAGELPVILGAGWPGVLLHEAVGHGLEGDFNRKKTSLFSGLLGQQVTAKGVTVVDDGTIESRAGSLTIDDEGTPSQNTVLIDDGILVGYMQDRLNARLMGMTPTGNGRRQSFGHMPMPRMTNTLMMPGGHSLEEMIATTQRGIYAPDFSGGQVDITSGNFVFTCKEAYMVENGKITSPIKGATLIGNGPEIMKRIIMIGNDFSMHRGIGVCGKDGQSIPVGIGQPSLKISHMTVGGTG